MGATLFHMRSRPNGSNLISHEVATEWEQPCFKTKNCQPNQEKTRSLHSYAVVGALTVIEMDEAFYLLQGILIQFFTYIT